MTLMPKFQHLLIAAALLCNPWLAQADSAATPHPHGKTMRLVQPHARASAPGQTAAAAYVTIVNAGPADRLLSASAPISKSVEMHSMVMEGDVMRMRPLEAIDVPSGRSIELKPGRLHLMFMGLKAPLRAGDRFALRLRFERAGEVVVDVPVQAAGTGAPSGTTDARPHQMPGHAGH